ncbi:hypothetical protein BJY04DRAFT_184763 [Aspergillus karnatakaensis]|uniref:uncharacterized protein n=1 Tax=Aspergillus karnatakaensis TaxID=1810916 RepID=UPI003CCD1A05
MARSILVGCSVLSMWGGRTKGDSRPDSCWYRPTYESLDETFEMLMLNDAVRRGDAMAVDKLLDLGYRPEVKNSRFNVEQPIRLATREGNVDVIEVFIKHGLPSRSHMYLQLLTTAAENRRVEALQVWIRATKGDPRAEQHIQSAVCSMASTDKTDMIEILLQFGPRNPSVLRFFALHYAVGSKQLEMMEWLLSRGGFDPEMTTDYLPHGLLKPLILDYGAREKKVRAMEILLEHGMDPNKVHRGLEVTMLQSRSLCLMPGWRKSCLSTARNRTQKHCRRE